MESASASLQTVFEAGQPMERRNCKPNEGECQGRLSTDRSRLNSIPAHRHEGTVPTLAAFANL